MPYPFYIGVDGQGNTNTKLAKLLLTKFFGEKTEISDSDDCKSTDQVRVSDLHLLQNISTIKSL